MGTKFVKPYDHVEVGKDVAFLGEPWLVIQIDSKRSEVTIRPYDPLEEPLRVPYDQLWRLSPRKTPRGPDEPSILVIDDEAALLKDGGGKRPPNSITIIDIDMEALGSPVNFVMVSENELDEEVK